MDILIDLRDSSWLEQVRLRVDSLIPTDRVGFYRIRSTLELRLFLRENRIRFNRVDEVPAGTKTNDSAGSESKNSDSTEADQAKYPFLSS